MRYSPEFAIVAPDRASSIWIVVQDGSRAAVARFDGHLAESDAKTWAQHLTTTGDMKNRGHAPTFSAIEVPRNVATLGVSLESLETGS